MADFLSQGTFLPFKSPVAEIDLNVWSNIAQLAMQQQEQSEAMIDKATQRLFETNAKLSQDAYYKSEKQKALNKDIESLRNSNGFFSPDARSKVRNIVRSYIFDPELTAINNRTTQMAEVQKQIRDQQLPASNYMEFQDSFLKAETEFAATGKYNPNVSLNFNVTPYTNVSEVLQKAIQNVPVVKNSKFVQDGNYVFVQTESGKNPNEVLNALYASLGSKEYQQLQQQYKYLKTTSPESLIVEKDVVDPTTKKLLYAKGDVLTQEQYIEQTLLRAASGVSGQSIEVTNLQKSTDWELYLEKVKNDYAIERIKAKNKGESSEEDAAIAAATSFAGATAMPIKTDNFNKTISEHQDSKNALATLKEQRAQAEAANDKGQMARLDQQIAMTEAQVTATEQAIARKSASYTANIPSNVKQDLIYGGTTVFGTHANTAPTVGVLPQQQAPSYASAYKTLFESIQEAVREKEISADDARKLLSYFPTIDPSKNRAQMADQVLAQVLSMGDIDKLRAEIQSTDAFKRWDESSWTKGTISSWLGVDPIGSALQSLHLTREYALTKYKAVHADVDKIDKEIAVIETVTGGQYSDAKGVARDTPIKLLNDHLTDDAKRNPANYVDSETGIPLSTMISNLGASFDHLEVSTTTNYVNGQHALQVSLFKKSSGENREFVETRYVYNPSMEDPHSYAKSTIENLRQSGLDAKANLLEAGMLYESKIQAMRPEGLPTVNNINDAIDKSNYVDVVLAITDDNKPIALRIYKVNDRDYRAVEVVGGVEDKEGLGTSYSSTRSIALSIYNSKRVADKKLSGDVAANMDNTRQAVETIFSDLEPKKQDMLIKLIGYETAGTYSTTAENKQGALGLIQFYPNKDKKYVVNNGTTSVTLTKEQLAKYNHTEQISLTKHFYAANNLDIAKFNTTAEMWLGVFLPSLAKKYQDDPANVKNLQIQDAITKHTNLTPAQVMAGQDPAIIDAINRNVSVEVFLKIMDNKFLNY